MTPSQALRGKLQHPSAALLEYADVGRTRVLPSGRR